jgi:hypothetical protein
MHKSIVLGFAFAGATLISLSLAAAAENAMMPASAMKPAAAAASDRKLIASAMTAAPRAVATNATIVVMGPDGTMRTLRQGTGSFTCMPDNPTTPGPDPMCMDRYAMEWVQAWAGHKPPTPGRVGFIYMLAGGTDASNTDPYAKAPTAANHWIKTGSHVMVVGAGAAYYYSYPRSADPNTSAPYVMWAGTPYQHTMIPVK